MPKGEITAKLSKLSDEQKKELMAKLKSSKISSQPSAQKQAVNFKIKSKKNSKIQTRETNSSKVNGQDTAITNELADNGATGEIFSTNGEKLPPFANDTADYPFSDEEEKGTIAKRGLVRHLRVFDELNPFFSGGMIHFTEDYNCFGLCNYEIVLYNIEDRAIMRSFKHVNEEIAHFTVSADGKLIATFTRNSMLRILLVDEKKIKAAQKMMGCFASELEFDKSGSILVMGDPSGTVTVFDTKNLKILQQFRPHNG
jgi:WD40 repeat protein